MGIVQSLFGGVTPPLKPQGAAPFAQPPDRDRQALFWWLKRNTSYTAIKHNAKLWEEAMAVFEKWVRRIEDPYPRIIEALKFGLDTQICYEKGLTRLRHGDHSVFSPISTEGNFGQLFTASLGDRIDWFNPPPAFVSERDSCPVGLVEQYLAAHAAAMNVGCRAEYEGLDLGDVDTRFPVHASAVISARSLLSKLPFDTRLPEPQWDVSFKPGARAPKDGIYEQVDTDGHLVGNMEYFVKGQSSEREDDLVFGPRRWSLTNKSTAEYFWRLLWEDTRYKDGLIPQEEQYFPTPSDSVSVRKALEQGVKNAVERLRCEANQPCPREGYWHTPAKTDSRRHFQVGEVMPDLHTDYGSTIWVWDETQG